MSGLEALKLLKEFIENDHEGIDKLFVEGSIDIIKKELDAFQKIKERIGIRRLMDDFDYLFDYDEYELLEEAMK